MTENLSLNLEWKSNKKPKKIVTVTNQKYHALYFFMNNDIIIMDILIVQFLHTQITIIEGPKGNHHQSFVTGEQDFRREAGNSTLMKIDTPKGRQWKDMSSTPLTGNRKEIRETIHVNVGHALHLNRVESQTPAAQKMCLWESSPTEVERSEVTPHPLTDHTLWSIREQLEWSWIMGPRSRRMSCRACHTSANSQTVLCAWQERPTQWSREAWWVFVTKFHPMTEVLACKKVKHCGWKLPLDQSSKTPKKKLANQMPSIGQWSFHWRIWYKGLSQFLPRR